jgi:Ras-related protein Rab-6A
MTSNYENNIIESEEFKIELLQEDYPQYDLSFKLIFIGDPSIGKSCLTQKAIKNNFEEYYQATVGFEFLTYNLKINDKVVKLQIWDTCGQEIYRSLISNFYRNSSLAVLMYAINDKGSFNHVESWLSELKNNASSDISIILVGNKADLEEDRQVMKDEGENYKKQNYLDLFMETSAKTGYNARNILIKAAKILYKRYEHEYKEHEYHSGYCTGCALWIQQRKKGEERKRESENKKCC